MARHEMYRIADQLDRVVGGPAWLGPSLDDVLARVSWRQAAARPIPAAHSIAEVTAHVEAWLDIVRRRVAGTAPSRISRRLDWPPARVRNAREWRARITAVGRAGRRLAALVRTLDDDRLTVELPGLHDTWTTYVSLHGVVQHVAYHAGQIALLAKAGEGSR